MTSKVLVFSCFSPYHRVWGTRAKCTIWTESSIMVINHSSKATGEIMLHWTESLRSQQACVHELMVRTWFKFLFFPSPFSFLRPLWIASFNFFVRMRIAPLTIFFVYVALIYLSILASLPTGSASSIPISIARSLCPSYPFLFLFDIHVSESAFWGKRAPFSLKE